MRVLGGVLIPAAALALGREALPTLKPQSEIPLPSPALSEALKTQSPREILRDPKLAQETNEIFSAMLDRFGRVETAVLIQGAPEDAQKLIPAGADLAAIRAVIAPIRAVVRQAEYENVAQHRAKANELGTSQDRGL